MDADRLAAVLDQRYGLAVEELVPVPDECTLSTWSARTAEARYAVKAPVDGSAVRLLDRLGVDGLGVATPTPVRTLRGRLRATPRATPPVGVLRWLDGVTPAGWPDWPASVLHALGGGLARLHGRHDLLPGRRTLRLGLPSRAAGERAAVWWYAQRRPELDSQAAALLTRRATTMTTLLHRLHHLPAGTRRRTVRCHTDVSGDNVVVDAAGQVGLIDWDGADVAPAETDLVLVARDQHSSEPLRTMVAGYREAGGGEPSLELLARCLLQRFVSDGVARLAVIADPAATPEQRTAAAVGFDELCLAPAAGLSETIELAAESLR